MSHSPVLVMANRYTVVNLSTYQGLELVPIGEGYAIGARRTLAVSSSEGSGLVEDVQFFAYFLARQNKPGEEPDLPIDRAKDVMRDLLEFWSNPEGYLDICWLCDELNDNARKKLGMDNEEGFQIQRDYKPSVYSLLLRPNTDQRDLLKLSQMQGQRIQKVEVAGSNVAIYTGEDSNG